MFRVHTKAQKIMKTCLDIPMMKTGETGLLLSRQAVGPWSYLVVTCTCCRFLAKKALKHMSMLTRKEFGFSSWCYVCMCIEIQYNVQYTIRM